MQILCDVNKDFVIVFVIVFSYCFRVCREPEIWKKIALVLSIALFEIINCIIHFYQLHNWVLPLILTFTWRKLIYPGYAMPSSFLYSFTGRMSMCELWYCNYILFFNILLVLSCLRLFCSDSFWAIILCNCICRLARYLVFWPLPCSGSLKKSAWTFPDLLSLASGSVDSSITKDGVKNHTVTSRPLFLPSTEILA